MGGFPSYRRLLGPARSLGRRGFGGATLNISRFVGVLVLQISLVSSASSNSNNTTKAAADYLTHAFDLMQQYAPYHKEIDWPKLKHEAFAYATHAQTSYETYPAIVYACVRQRDHSCRLLDTFRAPDAIQQQILEMEMAATNAKHGLRLTSQRPSPFGDRKSFLLAMLGEQDHRYAYIVIPSTDVYHAMSNQSAAPRNWADRLSDLVVRGHRDGAKGWILDLRGNSSGLIAPVLAGLQTLLGTGKVLDVRGPRVKYSYAVEAGKVVKHWGLGNSYVDGQVDEPTKLNLSSEPVIILLDHGTSETGEWIAMAFKGRGNTLFIGKRTRGFTEIGVRFELSDGAMLWLEEGQVYDRFNRYYAEGVSPDIEVDDPPSVTRISEDPAVLRAEEWLSTEQ